MESNNISLTTSQPSAPSSEFWRALLLVYNRHLALELSIYQICPAEKQSPRPIIEALQLVDCWLDIAIHDGWLKDTNSVS